MNSEELLWGRAACGRETSQTPTASAPAPLSGEPRDAHKPSRAPLGKTLPGGERCRQRRQREGWSWRRRSSPSGGGCYRLSFPRLSVSGSIICDPLFIPSKPDRASRFQPYILIFPAHRTALFFTPSDHRREAHLLWPLPIPSVLPKSPMR